MPYQKGLSILFLLVASALSQDPVVKLSHGGSLQGKSVNYNGTTLDLFLGVRYARPPVGDLRFKKPQEVEPWTGIVSAKNVGHVCWQSGIGSEDCLFLDITVPGGVSNATKPGSEKKAVMVWIHGGGFTVGDSSSFIGAGLATLGDVIVVVLNYRLGIFGFLSDGPGTGNFGLWDQRAAILWVKNNIEKFGGDPNLITIFGESAGSASVHAQTLSAKNDNLFQRAIMQSGTLFTSWAWYQSERQRSCLIRSLKSLKNCNTASVYECFKEKSTAQVVEGIDKLEALFDSNWKPYPDNDFFPENINDESNDLTKRFDVLAGYNGQEGGLFIYYYLQTWADIKKTSLADGISASWTTDFLDYACKATYQPRAPQDCKNLIMSQYGLSSGDNSLTTNRQRLINLSFFFGEEGWSIGPNALLNDHSQSNRSTYGYYFTERYIPTPGKEQWPYIDWAKVSADHADELMFVWGAPLLKKENDLLAAYVGNVKDWEASEIGRYPGFPDASTSLSIAMMMMWTNFAKTGNPNTPKSVAGLPTWPQYNSTGSSRYMELRLNSYTVRDTPNAARMNYVYENLFKPRRVQTLADNAAASEATCGSYSLHALGDGFLIKLSVLLMVIYFSK